jgi:WD40 repeat protein
LQITNYAAHVDFITALTFSPDGEHIATTGYDQVTEVWEARTWRNEAILKGHIKNVTAAAFFPDHRHLATAGADEMVKLWDWARHISKKNRVELPEGPTSKLIAGGSNQEYFGCASPEHTILALGTADGRGVMVDTVHGRLASEFTLTGGPITQVAAGPQAAMLAFVNRHGSVSLWDTAHASNVCTFELSSTQTVNQLVFAPNARWLMAAGAGGLLRLWDVLERKEIKAWRDKTNQIAAVLFSPDSATVACGHISGRIRLWEPASARLICELPGHTYGMNRFAFSPNGKRLASTGWDASVRIWDLPTRREIARFRGSRSSYFRVGFSPDGTLVFVNEWDESILFDIEAQRQIARLKTFMPVFLDEDTVLGLSQNELWHWRPPRLAEIDAAEKQTQGAQ